MSLEAHIQVDRCRDLLRRANISQVVERSVILSQINTVACKGTMSITITVTRRSLTAISDHMAKNRSLACTYVMKIAAPK